GFVRLLCLMSHGPFRSRRPTAVGRPSVGALRGAIDTSTAASSLRIPRIERGARFNSPAMADTTDTANVIVRPPIAWPVAVLAGLALNWLMPLPFVPVAVPAGWLGTMVFALALALVAWGIATIIRAGSNVPTHLPTTTIVDTGPYRFTRNPIYLGMVLGL